MALYWYNGQVLDDSQEGVRIREGAQALPTYHLPSNPAQVNAQGEVTRGTETFTWDPARRVYVGEASGGVDFLPWLMGWMGREPTNALEADEQAQWRQSVEAARAIPTRDLASLQASWAGQSPEDEAWWTSLNPLSPDAASIALRVRERMDAGTATAQERELYASLMGMATDWQTRASRPDPWSPLGDQFFGALGVLGMGSGAAAALAPLYAGAGLTLGSAAGLAGTAGGMTSMMGQALDNEALSKAGGALSMLGGLSGMGSILSKGISSLGDVLSLGKGLYGTATKGLSLARSGGGGEASTGGGGGMDSNQLGGILSGIVGAVGTGLSLADAGRYMEQLKGVYGQEQNLRKMIDEAYALAAARYDVYYAQTQEQYQQAQEAYGKAQERYETYYGNTQQEQQQRQEAYAKGQGQKDADRTRQIETWQAERGKVDSNFQQREAQARQIFDMQTQNYGMNRDQALADYNRRVAEAQEDRGREISVFNENWGRHLGSYDRAVAESQQERAMDMAGYQARHQIGATLRDPTQIKAGAEALYQPLSELARGRISQNAQAEMASRGVTGGGMYANRLSAEAFAPHEQALWNNALNAYLSGQSTALNAYGNVDLASAPAYREMQTPNFSGSPEWRPITMPNFENLPDYRAQQVPDFLRTGVGDVPGSVGYTAPPGVPGATNPGQASIDRNVPRPYAPGGAGGSSGGMGGLLSGAGGVGGIAGLVSNITKLFGLGGSGGRSWSDLSSYEQTQIQNEITAAMQNNELYGFGDAGGGDYGGFSSAPESGPDWFAGSGVYAPGYGESFMPELELTW